VFGDLRSIRGGTYSRFADPVYITSSAIFSLRQSMQSNKIIFKIPQPGGWGSFIPAYEGDADETPESPNRQVGDRSFQPTADRQARL
jgi:hypothetical protein